LRSNRVRGALLARSVSKGSSRTPHPLRVLRTRNGLSLKGRGKESCWCVINLPPFHSFATCQHCDPYYGSDILFSVPFPHSNADPHATSMRASDHLTKSNKSMLTDRTRLVEETPFTSARWGRLARGLGHRLHRSGSNLAAGHLQAVAAQVHRTPRAYSAS